MADRYGIEVEHTSVLKELYAQYLVNVRHVGKTTIKHYLDALKYVSKELADKGLIDSNNTIYDVDDVDKLISIRDALLADSEFIALIEAAGHICEISKGHTSFIARSDNKPYMEGHHAIAMNRQSNFKNSLDVYANIICLCPMCHRMIHFGLDSIRRNMLEQIYDERKERLAKCNIDVSRNDFVALSLAR